MIVKPSGPTTQPILALVGEAPGAEEERLGKPFMGSSGQMLNRMLAACGIEREKCYITNVTHERPPKNDFRAHYYSDKKGMKPTEALIDQRVRLAKELKDCQPEVIITFGEEALRAVAHVTGVTNRRGMMIETFMYGRSTRIMPTFHPAHVLRNYQNRPIVELDLKKAYRQALHPHIPKTKFNIHPTFDEIMSFFKAKHSPVSWDIETTRNPIRTRRIGFGWSDTEAISIPFIWGGTHAWGIDQEILILQSMNNYLADESIKKYVQNGAFDNTVVANEFGFHVEGTVLDTMYAWHLLYPELPKSLDFLNSVHTDFPMYWSDKHGGDEPNAEYNCYDLCATFISSTEIIKELIERNLFNFYHKHIHSALPCLTRMQNRGILIDQAAREPVRKETQVKQAAAQLVLDTAAHREVNANSPKQIQELIYGDWKLPTQRSLQTKAITTDDDALRMLSRKYPNRKDALTAILSCRQARKLISTYIDAELDNGYFRTSYGVAVTGRLTSSKTIEGFGGNSQNIPRGPFRRLYIPDPGKVLLRADLNQAEYMVFCWEAPVPEFIHAYTYDETFDVHLLNSSRIFKVDASLITKEQRYDTKQCVYAGNYGAGAQKLSKMLDMDYQQTRLIIEGYKDSRPELEIWWRRVEETVRTTRTLHNVFGRERIFFGRIDHSLFRAAYDWICQSTVADLINLALVELDNSDEVDVILQVHDELVLQCDDNPAAIHAAVVKIRSCMEREVIYPNIETPMRIPVEISVGPNWYDVTEYKESEHDNLSKN